MDLELHSDTSTEDSRGVAANALALGALASMAIAYLQMFTVLGGTHYASKFENGELPAGVVEQQVEPPVALEHAVEEPLNRLVVADVHRLGLGGRPQVRQIGDELLERLGPPAAAGTTMVIFWLG